MSSWNDVEARAREIRRSMATAPCNLDLAASYDDLLDQWEARDKGVTAKVG